MRSLARYRSSARRLRVPAFSEITWCEPQPSPLVHFAQSMKSSLDGVLFLLGNACEVSSPTLKLGRDASASAWAFSRFTKGWLLVSALAPVS